MQDSSRSDSVEPIGTTSTGLIDRLKVHDEDAWRRLVRLYGRLVHYWCREAGLNEADRADVFQEVFRAVAVHIPKFRRQHEGDSFRAWLRTITRSKIVDQFRRKTREPDGAGGTDTYRLLMASPEELASESTVGGEASEPVMLIQQALEIIRDEFEPRTWEAFWRTTADEIPTAVVADELAMSQAAVRKAKSRVLRRLRDEFAGLEDFDVEMIKRADS